MGARVAAGCALAVAALASAGCATGFTPPPSGAAERARAERSFSAVLRVSLKGPEFRARTRALVAFRRPDGLRVEVPGPAGGTRVVAVTRDGRLTAVFPDDRAVFRADADEKSFASLFGLALAPGEVMDLLVGTPSPRLKTYHAGWGPSLPRRIAATLPDGARLEVTVEDAGTGVELGAAAFEEPPNAGYREIVASEARRLWSSR